MWGYKYYIWITMRGDRGWKSCRPTGRGRKGPTGSKVCNRVIYLWHPQVLGCPSPEAGWPRVIRKSLHLLQELNDLFSNKWLFTLHWVQISFPLGILQSSATNPLLTTQDDLLWGLTSFEGAERESGAATCCCRADRSAVVSGLTAMWFWHKAGGTT